MSFLILLIIRSLRMIAMFFLIQVMIRMENLLIVLCLLRSRSGVRRLVLAARGVCRWIRIIYIRVITLIRLLLLRVMAHLLVMLRVRSFTRKLAQALITLLSRLIQNTHVDRFTWTHWERRRVAHVLRHQRPPKSHTSRNYQ